MDCSDCTGDGGGEEGEEEEEEDKVVWLLLRCQPAPKSPVIFTSISSDCTERTSTPRPFYWEVMLGALAGGVRKWKSKMILKKYISDL